MKRNSDNKSTEYSLLNNQQMHSKMLMALEGKKIDKKRVKREVQIKKEQNFETMNMCVLCHIRRKPRAVKRDTDFNKNQASDEI